MAGGSIVYQSDGLKTKWPPIQCSLLKLASQGQQRYHQYHAAIPVTRQLSHWIVTNGGRLAYYNNHIRAHAYNSHAYMYMHRVSVCCYIFVCMLVLVADDGVKLSTQ